MELDTIVKARGIYEIPLQIFSSPPKINLEINGNKLLKNEFFLGNYKSKMIF